MEEVSLRLPPDPQLLAADRSVPSARPIIQQSGHDLKFQMMLDAESDSMIC